MEWYHFLIIAVGILVGLGVGFGLGIGDDLGGFALRFRDQTFGLGATLLQPLVVELLGQLLKFVLHSVLIIVIQ